jgi:ribonuclease T2
MRALAVVAAVFVATPVIPAPPAVSSPRVLAAGDCILDHCADRRPAASAPRGGAAPGAFDYYLLALSWSPSFCANGGARKSRVQCASGANPGFVVHGLWPQFAGGGFAPGCDGGGFLPYNVVVSLRDLYPDDGLARHEWRAHGACSGKSPTAYFADVRAARAAVTVPPEFLAPREDRRISPLDIQRAFIEANPRLRPGMMAATCRDGALAEARICLSKDLRDFVACPEVVRRGCRAQSIVVPAGR